MHYSAIANSPGMWLACAGVVLVIITQAFIFMKKAYTAGLQMGISRETMFKGMRAGLISSIGPSFAIAVTLLSLIMPLGSPFSWLRLSVIGSVPYELMAAKTAAQIYGVELGGVGYDINTLALAVWTATIAAGGWLIPSSILIPKYEMLRVKIVQGREELLPLLSVAALIAAFSSFSLPYIIKGGPSTVAAITGGVVMLLLLFLSTKVKWLREWALGLAMLAGMLAALPFI